jgi:hypothetical protein
MTKRRRLTQGFLVPGPPFELSKAHRWFGIEFNNAAWELVEAASRTPAETERMLRLAHASCLHWEAVGTLANTQRGLVLLAMAHAVAGLGSRAVELAQQAIALGESHDDLLTPFDRAAAAACMATALRGQGDLHDMPAWEAKTNALAANLDEDDRTVIQRLLSAPVASTSP